jgi:glycine/sarcosine/betaine reductase complex component A
VKQVAEQYSRDELVVLLGSPDAESAELFAETVMLGDPTFAGPLAGIALKLPVYFIAEEPIRRQIPPEVYDMHVSLMELALPVEEISDRVRAVRERAAEE